MRKKLLISILSTVVLSLILVTVLFGLIIKSEHDKIVEGALIDNNNRIVNLLESENIVDKKKFFEENFKDSNIRVTYMDEKGNILYDSVNNEMINNNNNYIKEVKENGYVIRSSMPMEYVNSFEKTYIKYCIIILILVFSISIIISIKFANYVLKPLKQLKDVTEDIAKGDLNKRVFLQSKDEISKLANTFNEMADKLQYTINNSLEQQNRLEAILTSMDSGIIAVDKEKRIIISNPYADRTLELKDNLIGENIYDIIKIYELEDIFEQKNFQNGETAIINFRNKNLKVRKTKIINNDEIIGTVAVIQDITEIRRLEKMRSQFVANVTHELKTPLTSIKGFAETLRDVEDPDIKNRFLNIIDDESDRLTRLINDILILSDIEQRKDVKLQDINVASEINNIYYLMKNTAESKNIELKITKNNYAIIYGDLDKFKQMLLNLVDNAIKYSEEGDKVSISSITTNKQCMIVVEDTGTGIPEEHISRLFERFYRVDEARSRENGGTGLGLAIVKHIVLGFNGEIKVESVFGEGSKFTIIIPQKK